MFVAALSRSHVAFHSLPSETPPFKATPRTEDVGTSRPPQTAQKSAVSCSELGFLATWCAVHRKA